jgi:Holliday junction resolvasome RuvABC DNA-binding subunit
MKIKEVNTQTGEEIEREMNADELAQREADAVAYAEQKTLDDAAAQAKAEAKASAFNKLEALGLTAEEVATIIDGLK